MSLLSYFVPQDLLRASSPYNHDIRVQSFMGKKLLMVNGSLQSGAYVEGLWRKSMSVFGVRPSIGAKSILVLGVGGGTVIHLLHDFFPGARIVGVDIDPAIIGISKKYFGLKGMEGLTLKAADAQEFVKKEAQARRTYDVAVIDLFVGRHIPAFVTKDTFMRNVKSLLGPGGFVLINYLREREYGTRSDAFAGRLTTLFVVRDFSLFRNRFFCLKKA
jgi:spermidine synthase